MIIEKTILSNGNESVVLLDDEFNIIEPVLLFTSWLELKGASPNTISSYVRDLGILFDWLNEVGIRFYEVKPAYVPDLIRYIDKRGKGVKAPSTINRYLAAISSFYRHFEALGGYFDQKSSPIVSFKGYRPNDMGKSFFHHIVNRSQIDYSYFRLKQKKKNNTRRVFGNQIDTFYKSFDEMTVNRHVKSRNKLMFRLMYETGFRVSEVLNLHINDFSVPVVGESLGLISVKKHEDPHPDRQIKTLERTIPVGMDLIYALDEFVTTIRPMSGTVPNVFVSDNSNNPLVRKTVNLFFKEISTKSGVKITPHYLRHTHGTELAEMGYDSLYISARLGHKSVESTKQYTHISLEAMIRAYERFERNKGGITLW